jgi:hypothetical protein
MKILLFSILTPHIITSVSDVEILDFGVTAALLVQKLGGTFLSPFVRKTLIKYSACGNTASNMAESLRAKGISMTAHESLVDSAGHAWCFAWTKLFIR